MSSAEQSNISALLKQMERLTKRLTDLEATVKELNDVQVEELTNRLFYERVKDPENCQSGHHLI